MIELQKEDNTVEQSAKPKRAYRALERGIGRIVRLEVDEHSWGLERTSGKLLSIHISGTELEFAIEGAERIELDLDEETLRLSVLQTDTGKWKRLYESKDWEGGDEL